VSNLCCQKAIFEHLMLDYRVFLWVLKGVKHLLKVGRARL
jgi:hypothetical protein